MYGVIGTIEEYKTERDARHAADAFCITINQEAPAVTVPRITLGFSSIRTRHSRSAKLPRGWKELGVDLLSMAGHKLYAPKGIGVLYVCKGVRLEPLIHGAGHEAGRRAGTENILLDVALGAACELAQQWLGMDSTRELRDLFWEWLQARFGERVVLNGHPRSLTTPVSVFSCPPLPAGVGGAAIGSEPKVVDLLINQRLQPV